MGEWSDQFTQQKLYFNLGHITRKFVKSHLTRESEWSQDFRHNTFYSTKGIIKHLTIAVDSLLMKRKTPFLDDRKSIKILR